VCEKAKRRLQQKASAEMLQILVKMVKNLEKRAVTWWPPIPIPIPVSIAIAIAFATWQKFLGSANRHFLRPTCQPHQQIEKNLDWKTCSNVIGPPN